MSMTTDIPQDVQTRQLSREERRRLAVARRAAETPRDPLAGLSLDQRRAERAKREARAPQVRAQRERELAVTAAAARAEEASLETRLASVEAQVKDLAKPARRP